jgi:CheY-like chemotaxis protein
MSSMSATRPTRVFLCDDNVDLRLLLNLGLGEHEDLEVVGEAGDGAAGVDGVAEHEPDVVLLDLAMPVMDGWAFRSAQQRDPRLARIPTIVLSASLDLEGRRFDGPAPAAAFSKPFDLGRLLDALRRCCDPLLDAAPARAAAADAGAATLH